MSGAPPPLGPSSARSTNVHLAQSTPTPAAPERTSDNARKPCTAPPLKDRTLYLRGSATAWAADERLRLRWACNRYELVARLEGEQRFKIGDDAWSADADFGRPNAAAPPPRRPAPPPGTLRIPLRAQGSDIAHRFAPGNWRITMSLDTPTDAHLDLQPCPAAPPLGATTLYLRGSMNGGLTGSATDAWALQWHCDAYVINTDLNGLHSFRIADAAGSPATSFGAAPGGRDTPAIDHALGLARGSDAGGIADLRFIFGGEQTLALAFDANGAPEVTIGPRRFADARAPAVKDPVALSVRHHSREAAYRSPFGAVPAGTAVRFALEALPGVERATLVLDDRELIGNQEVLRYTEARRLPMQRRPGADGRERFEAEHRFGQIAVQGYWFELVIGGRTYVYQNNADTVAWTREKGSGGLGEIADAPARPQDIRRWRLSVYDPAFKTPAWAADAVWYYIFPDRFRNGDKTNDPRPGNAAGNRRYQNHGLEFHERWLSKPYKPGSGDGSDGVYNNDFHGGDLKGIEDKLDDLADLGINALYLTPIFRAASNHRYDHADYTQVDPILGTNADFERLAQAAGRRGIRVVVDASLNHTGSDSLYFDRYGNFGGTGAFAGGKLNPTSPYASWYRLDPTQPDPDKQYRGWVGVSDLPELDKNAPAWRDFAYRAPDSITRRWLRAGASGWRMDVAPWVPDDFWREWRAAVKAEQPQAVTIAETWFDAAKHLLGDMFDSTMNYVFRNAVLDYAKGGSARALVAQLELLRENTPPPAHAVLMNLLSTHDQARSLHVLGWDRDDTPPAQVALAQRRYRLALLLQMAWPGAPAVYYGDEVGMTGGDDPYNRGPYPWADEGGQPDLALRAEFKRLIALRKAEPVLRHGSLEAPLFVDEHGAVWLRRLGGRWALIALNNADSARTIELPAPPGVAGPAAPAPPPAAGAGRLGTGASTWRLELPPLSGAVWLGGR